MEVVRSTDTRELKRYMFLAEIESIKDLAAKSGVSATTINNVLLGKAQPSSETMLALVKALNIPLDKAGSIFFSTNLHEMQD